MPQNLGGLSIAAGFARGFGPQFAAGRRQRLEQERKGLEDEMKSLVKAASILAEHPLYGKEHPLYLQNQVEQYKLITGKELGGGAPQRMEMPTQGRPPTRLPFPASGDGGVRTPTAIAGSGSVARQELTALAKAGEERMKPSQGIGNRYKTIGTQMVKQAETIVGLKKLIPEKGKKKIQYAEAQVSRAEQEMERLQALYDRLRTYAAGQGVTLEQNTWDVYAATVKPSAVPKTKLVQDMTDDELMQLMGAGGP